MNAPRLPVGHADRTLELEEHIESTLNALMEDVVSAGWTVDEAQAAVRNIADIFKARCEAYADTDRKIAEAMARSSKH